MQLVPGNVPETQKEEAQKYLDSYFSDLKIHVYWQDCHEFAKELRERWEKKEKAEKERAEKEWAEKEWAEKEQAEKGAFNRGT